MYSIKNLRHSKSHHYSKMNLSSRYENYILEYRNILNFTLHGFITACSFTLHGILTAWSMKKWIFITLLLNFISSMYFLHNEKHGACLKNIMSSLLIWRLVSGSLLHAIHGNGRPKISQILYQNIPGTCKSLEISIKIEEILQKFSPQILFVGEADTEEVSKCQIKNYNFVRGTCHGTNKIRVSALIHNSLQHSVETWNCMVPTVVIKVDNWRFVGCYREWAHGGLATTRSIQQQEERFKTFVDIWKKLNGRNVVLGDVNIDFDNADSAHQMGLSGMRDLINEEIICKGWLQLINKYTRRANSSDSSTSILDHIYVSQPKYISVIHNLNIIHSDHHLIGVDVSLDKPVFEQQSFLSRNYKKIKIGEFETLLDKYKIDEVYHEFDLDTCVDMFTQKILSALNRVAPERRVVTREHYAEWLTDELKDDIDRRNDLRREAILEDDEDIKLEKWNAYKRYRNDLRNRLRLAKTEYLKSQFNIKDSKLRWARLQNATGLSKKTSKCKIKLQTEKGIISKPSETAEYLNKYFKEKVTKLKERTNKDIPKMLEYARRYLADKKVGEFAFRGTDFREVVDVITGLNNTNCTGVDGISTYILKRYKFKLAGPLMHICNLSLTKSQYPTLWKIGITSPIPKKDNPQELLLPQNWRPVQLNCIPSKVLETLMNQQLRGYLESYGLISPTQRARS